MNHRLPAPLAICLFLIASLMHSFLTAASPALPVFQESQTTQAEKPNLLFIYIDDLGWRDTGFMGSDFYETPNLDSLANQGMVFSDAYAGAANCAPSRACLMSGQYSPRHKIYNVGTRPRGKSAHRRLQHIPGTDTLDPAIKTWAQQLQQTGYKTATMGKWHLSDDPIPYGFDVNVGGSHSGGPPKGYYPPHKDLPGLKDRPKDEYLTDLLTERASEFIAENQDNPWALYLTHFAVHTPLNAKKSLLAKYESKPAGQLHQHAKMATMIQAVDDGVGRLKKLLDKLNLSDNTLILFYSDNGGYGPATDMAPLKGYKGTYYEGGIRVPFFAHWPGKIAAGTKTDQPITAVDFFPTICNLAGAKPPADQEMDGVNLMPLLLGDVKTLQPRALYWHFPAYLQSYGSKDIFEQRDPLFRSRPCSVIRRGDWKLHQYFEDGGVELYDLRNDPGESRNLVDSKPEKAQALLDELSKWRETTAAPIPATANPEFDAAAEKQAIQKMMQRKNKVRQK